MAALGELREIHLDALRAEDAANAPRASHLEAGGRGRGRRTACGLRLAEVRGDVAGSPAGVSCGACIDGAAARTRRYVLMAAEYLERAGAERCAGLVDRRPLDDGRRVRRLAAEARGAVAALAAELDWQANVRRGRAA